MANERVEMFRTISDAQTGLDGYRGWEWGGRASLAGWVAYARQHAEQWSDGADARNNLAECLTAYLRSVGEDPDAYGVGR